MLNRRPRRRKDRKNPRKEHARCPAFKIPLRALCIALPVLAAIPAQAQTAAKYDSGADDKKIRIGTTAPLSGPVSAFAQISKSAEAYFRKVNDEGGINGRRIELIIADDAYSPPKTVEQTRRLVESDEVLLIFGGVGTPTNSAVHKYLNDRKVPQLFLGSGAAKWDDPKNFPWTVGWQPSYRDEAFAYATIHQGQPSERQGRGALPERRSRQGLSEGAGREARQPEAATCWSPRRPTRPPRPPSIRRSCC